MSVSDFIDCCYWDSDAEISIQVQESQIGLGAPVWPGTKGSGLKMNLSQNPGLDEMRSTKLHPKYSAHSGGKESNCPLTQNLPQATQWTSWAVGNRMTRQCLCLPGSGAVLLGFGGGLCSPLTSLEGGGLLLCHWGRMFIVNSEGAPLLGAIACYLAWWGWGASNHRPQLSN